ncbi:MAG: outer membrane lipid asymmetry maintenance protein MlaD [Syntrophobacteraceae bacterium CG2_30_61_12]|nr:MAG: outer membrane lipid asymmetry maintenance protein MlaD [Syntrophobacteraceae bacterium CG2_30_61_12]PIU32310.1 MAG: outer membrane lipid asymmetry maintenance protein MlaD [Syntrophobacteraceae bacterium CG07_land_8_20_14_0_80_61_8]
MQRYAMESVVGLFVLIGLACVGYMTIKLGDVGFLKSGSYSLLAKFTTVSGLRVGSPVEMVGLRIGKIAAMHLDQNDQMAVVELEIDQGIKIFDDAIASVKTSGLIGDKFIQIDAGGGGDLLQPGATIIATEAALDIGDLIGKYAFGTVGTPATQAAPPAPPAE